jgi:hypothetical protein
MLQKMYAETLENVHSIQCLQAEQTLDTVMNDLHTLFITGQGTHQHSRPSWMIDITLNVPVVSALYISCKFSWTMPRQLISLPPSQGS